ncbi:MAG: hypothetical protein LBU24_04070 [Methanocalculaceae archaeon]|jgi:predicted secreted protein|nr:hypothetical protein [Methanocalculaceae archaeon]
MVPLPCPETLYLDVPCSPGSFPDRPNTPEFAALLDCLEEDVRRLIAKCGERPFAVIGVDSSSARGVTATYYGDGKPPGPGGISQKIFLSVADRCPLVCKVAHAAKPKASQPCKITMRLYWL